MSCFYVKYFLMNIFVTICYLLLFLTSELGHHVSCANTKLRTRLLNGTATQEKWVEIRLPNGRLRWVQMGSSPKYSNQSSLPSMPLGNPNREQYDDLPSVDKPQWDAPMVKFNSAIITRFGEHETHICSGALISETFVVTVGTDCVFRQGVLYSPDDLFVIIMSYNKAQAEVVAYENRVKGVILHEGCYKHQMYLSHNDIVIIQLLDRIFYDDYIQPAKIPRRNVLHHPSVIHQWDLSNIRMYNIIHDFEDALWYVKTKLISNNVCEKYISPKLYQNIMMTCAAYHHTETSNCSADIGAALSYKERLIGVLLFKQNCGIPSGTALFVNMGVHSKWIEAKVAQLSNGQERIST